jgi:hypothetical protein
VRIFKPFFILILILIACDSFSQQMHNKYRRKSHTSQNGYLNANKYSKYFSGGLAFNLLNYFGDATPAEKTFINGIKVTRPGISAFLNYKLSGTFSLSSELSYGRIIGDDFNTSPDIDGSSIRKYVRNLSFRNDLVGLSITGKVNFLHDPYEYWKRKNFNIYALTGVSFFYSNPKTKIPEKSRDGVPFENAGAWVALRPLGTEGQNSPAYGNKYSAIQIGIPIGLGVRVRVGYKIDIQVETSISFILSDYIDDIGSSYVDLGVFDDELAKTLSDRSMEEKAVLKNEMRDMTLIDESTVDYSYKSNFDGKTYDVFKGFGHDDALRGGSRFDLISITSFKFSYIFAN